MSDELSKVMDKVRALFAKAESTDYEAEAEAFTAKAQEMLTRYALDRAEVMGGEQPDAIVIKDVAVPGRYRRARAVLLAAVAQSNGCYVVGQSGWRVATVAGTPAAIEACLTLWKSLMLQGDRMVLAATPVGDTRSFRSSWWYAFANRIGARLRKTQQEVAGGLLPVLLSEAERAEQALRAAVAVGGTARTKVRNRSGWQAGDRAGGSVNVGAQSVSGGRRALSR